MGSGLLASSLTWFRGRITLLNLLCQSTSPLSVFIWPSCLWWSKYGGLLGFHLYFFFTASIFNTDALYLFLFAHAWYSPPVCRQMTSRSSKSPDGTNNVNNGSYLFKCPGNHRWAVVHNIRALGRDAAICFIIAPVLFLLWPVKMSAMKKFLTQTQKKYWAYNFRIKSLPLSKSITNAESPICWMLQSKHCSLSFNVVQNWPEA